MDLSTSMFIADVEIAELRRDLQGRVPTGQPRRPKEAAGTRDGQEGRGGREKPREDQGAQQGHSQRVERTNVKMATHKDQSWCGLRLWGVCVRERCRLGGAISKNLQPLSPSEAPPSLFNPDHRKK